MKAISGKGFGARHRLQLEDVGVPSPGHDEVLVRVRASSVNPKDWKVNTILSAIAALFGLAWRFILGDDVAGDVVEVGRNVTGFAPGDAVYGMDMRFRTATLAEYAVISQNRIAHKPVSVSYAEAAAVPLAALTAWQAFRYGDLQAGQRVLIVGASGGVGTFAIQIAKALGAHVTGVCSGRNVDLVYSLGADDVIDYTSGDYRERAGNYDLIFDVTSHETPGSVKSLLRRGGMFISTAGEARAVLGILVDKFRVNGKFSRRMLVASNSNDLTAIGALIDDGKVRVVLDNEYTLEEVNEAFARSKSGRSRGKIAITVAA